MNTRRCPECRGIPVLGDDGLYCYSCGRAIHDPQKRLGVWCAAKADDEDDVPMATRGQSTWLAQRDADTSPCSSPGGNR